MSRAFRAHSSAIQTLFRFANEICAGRAESGCFGQTVLGRYAAVLKPAFRCARHAQTEFSLDVVGTKPGHVLFHHESAYTPIVILRPNHFYVCDGRIADPTFAAI